MLTGLQGHFSRVKCPMHTGLPFVILAFLAITTPALAKSARTTHPQLVGLDTISLHFRYENLPGLDAEGIEREVRDALEQAGFQIRETAPVTLFMRITYQQFPACPELIALRTYLALSEDVAIQRGGLDTTVYVETWHEGEDKIVATGTVGKIARQSMLGLVWYLIDAAQYTGKVSEKQDLKTSARAVCGSKENLPF